RLDQSRQPRRRFRPRAGDHALCSGVTPGAQTVRPGGVRAGEGLAWRQSLTGRILACVRIILPRGEGAREHDEEVGRRPRCLLMAGWAKPSLLFLGRFLLLGQQRPLGTLLGGWVPLAAFFLN